MPWTHDETPTPDAPNGTILCVSEKHGRDLTIRLPDGGELPILCYDCWRECRFEASAFGPLVRHHFITQKPVKEAKPNA